MKTENKVLMAQARETLAGKWGLAVGATFVYLVVSTLASIVPFGSLLVAGPLLLGLTYFFLMISRSKIPTIADIFYGFNHFVTALCTMLCALVFVILWSLLLIVPGIIAALSYSQIFYILADDSSLGALEAIKKSKKLMEGNKWKLLTLSLRFLGWGILCIFTCGIGFLWLLPYMQTTKAKFYDDIKNGAVEVVASQPADAVPAAETAISQPETVENPSTQTI